MKKTSLLLMSLSLAAGAALAQEPGPGRSQIESGAAA